MTGTSDAAFHPKARTQRLVVEPVDDALLVYDLDSDRAHSLNATAAMVWEAADGTRPVSELASLLVGLEPAAATDAVAHVLGELAERDLLVSPPPADVPRISRRQLMARLGAAGAAVMAFPFVDSIVAPLAAQQVSGLSDCSPCDTDDDCLSLNCMFVPGEDASFCFPLGSLEDCETQDDCPSGTGCVNGVCLPICLV